jgi:hypothetical protein
MGERKSVLRKALVLVGSLFAAGAADKKVFAQEQKSKHQYAMGTGWGGGAVFSPKRTKFKGFMRSTAYKKKHQR